jgi:hypothetical protein
MRASDADRDRYATVLQEAYAQGWLSREEYDERLDACMRAKTYGDLQPLVADLPPGNLPVVRPAADVVPAASASTAPMLAIFSSVERKGVWALEDDSYAVAVFGEVTLDLRDATIAARDNEIHAFAIFGSVTVYVEPGTRVECAGMGILGEFNQGKASPPDPDAPSIRVSGLALFGSVVIKEKARRLR